MEDSSKIRGHHPDESPRDKKKWNSETNVNPKDVHSRGSNPKHLVMKHNKNHENVRSAALQLVPVCFEFTHPTATTVCLAGTFNHWQPESKIQHSPSTGRWWKEMELAPGAYEYCLVVDGRWMPDPLARETVPNPFGGRNSVLKVASSPEAAHLAEAENLPLKNAIE
jgi:1,4-alpha-glucan branching enzyme